jgi:exodeoxyribonuclease VII small subunit
MGKKDPSFEQLFEELEATVQKLEAGNLALDESLALYERGMQLARTCNERLDRAELRLRELAPALDGQLETGEEGALEGEGEGG